MIRARLAVVVLLAALFGCRQKQIAHPNVLLITLDTFRADRIGPLTPNLARLASSGTTFDEAVSAVPLTLPSHATILSGLLPLHHGLHNNGAGTFPAGRPTLATVFATAGYRTAAFVSAFVLDHRFGLGRGFDLYDDAIARDPNGNSQYDAERRGSETVDRALAWLSAEGRPFFAWVHLYDPHAPYAPPKPFPQTYDGEIAYVDAQVGRLLDAVDRKRTIVAVIGDHGESLGEHGELTHGLLLYQATLHVPLVISVPGTDSATRLHEPVSAADLAPTLSSLALETPMAGDGADLSDDIRDHREPRRRDLYAESDYGGMFGWSELAAIRRGAAKLIQSTAPELYDLHNDPHEEHNVLDAGRRAFRSLSDALVSMRRTAIGSQPFSVDEETRARLASLGYAAPSAVPAAQGIRPSPAAMTPLFRTFEEANEASNANRAEDAIAALRSIVARDPRNPVFRGSLARALRQAGRLDEAIPLYKEAVAIAPTDAEAWYNLGVALQEAGRASESAAVLAEALRRDPTRPEAHNALGIAFVEEGNLTAAQAEFEKAIAIDPRDARAHSNMANVLRSGGKLDEAAREYEEALRLTPDYADALNGRGVVEVQRHRPEAALPYFDHALRITPRFYEAQLNRGIALQLAGDRAAAIEQFRSLLSSLPRTAPFAGQRQAASTLLLQVERSRARK